MRIKKLSSFPLIMALFLTCSIAQAAKPDTTCRIQATTFACPNGFEKLPDIDATIRLFRYRKDGNLLYFFVAIPVGDFDDSGIKQALGKYYSQPKTATFQWKNEQDPLVMDIKTKYPHKISASLGFWNEFLLELKTFHFSVRQNDIVIGYASNWGDTPRRNREKFEKGEGIGDQAVGCNAVMRTLNSITKEFKDKDQGCTLSALSAMR